MDARILKLAMNTLWCDIKHSFRGYGKFFMILSIVFALIRYNDTMILCFSWVIVMAMMKLMPFCDRILFVMPLGAVDRKRLMIYRQLMVEIVFTILLFVVAWLRALLYADGCQMQRYMVNNVVMIAFMMFEVGSSVFFCTWYKEASMREKGFGIFFSILAWVAFFTSSAMASSKSEGIFCYIAVGLGIGSVLVQALVKLYYMLHAEFAEYRFVSVNEGMAAANRKNVADERF